MTQNVGFEVGLPSRTDPLLVPEPSPPGVAFKIRSKLWLRGAICISFTVEIERLQMVLIFSYFKKES